MRGWVRRRLAEAARAYYEIAPWERVGDDYLFGIHDTETDLLGCASVMGNAGQEYGLSVQYGESGFSLLRKLTQAELDDPTAAEYADGLTLILAGVDEPVVAVSRRQMVGES